MCALLPAPASQQAAVDVAALPSLLPPLLLLLLLLCPL
jgi:hypothetical protein